MTDTLISENSKMAAEIEHLKATVTDLQNVNNRIRILIDNKQHELIETEKYKLEQT